MAPGYEATSTPVSAQADVMGTPKPTKVPPTPTPEPLTLDNNRYSLPSKALVFQIPLGWTLTYESGNKVRFDAPDKFAWMEAVVESSGYALPAENFQIYTENMRQALYANADSQNLLERQSEESRAVYVTSFSKEGVFWYAYDVFIQKEKAIYSCSFQTVQRLWDAYLPGFGSVVASAETNTGYVSADMIYSFMRSYASPNSQFTLTIPMSWTFTLGQDKLKNGVTGYGCFSGWKCGCDNCGLQCGRRIEEQGCRSGVDPDHQGTGGSGIAYPFHRLAERWTHSRKLADRWQRHPGL
jgi:hypothetical protein